MKNGRKCEKARRKAFIFGFTLIELLVVLAIIATLMAVSVPRYFHSIDKAKEVILAENLRITRGAIDKYFEDRNEYPASLERLVEFRYLRSVPFDPVANSSLNWVIIPPPDGVNGNVFDIRSSADGVSSDGKKYSEM